MGRMISPLRYPGGKGCMLELTSELLRANDLHRAHYAEPFAGGCGLALALLFSGMVAEIHINDIDPAIWAFWNSVLNETEAFVDLISTSKVTIDTWLAQRSLHRSGVATSSLELGFAAFFLNRTNRSGVISGGGVIGGLEQTGTYKIDCRFNRDDLVRRVRRIARYRNQIHLTNSDALNFLKNKLPSRSLLFIDPPYFKKGPGLYTSYYNNDDHERLASTVMELKTPWIVTYDNVPEIRRLYAPMRQFSFDINYSLNQKRVGTELLVASSRLHLPSDFRSHALHSADVAA